MTISIPISLGYVSITHQLTLEQILEIMEIGVKKVNKAKTILEALK